MKNLKYVLLAMLLNFFFSSCNNADTKLEKKIETIEAILNNTEPNSDYVNNSGLTSAKISSTVYPATTKDEEEAIIYILNDPDDNLYAVGIKTKSYGAYFETVDGNIIDYKNGTDIRTAFQIRNPKPDEGEEGFDCKEIVEKTGITNSATVACFQAICNAVNCWAFAVCSGKSQFDLNQERDHLCLKKPTKNGVYCYQCLE